MQDGSDSGPKGLSRRRALKILGGSASAVALPILKDSRVLLAMQAGSPQAGQAGKFFSPQQVQALDALAETVIPTDEHSPGSRTAGVWAYIDAIVADSDQKRKSLWQEGLASIDKMAIAKWGKSFAEGSAEQQTALLQKLCDNEEHPQTPEEHFFVALKRATIEGYYTSKIGIHQDLQYPGNTFVEAFPGCQHEKK